MIVSRPHSQSTAKLNALHGYINRLKAHIIHRIAVEETQHSYILHLSLVIPEFATKIKFFHS